jgi:DnaK suppressor protein
MTEEIKNKLEKEKKEIEEQLGKFATKDENLKGDWDTRFPRFNDNETGQSSLEQAADEVEAYTTLLPLEHNLELKLKKINSALERIKKGTYGICKKCGKKIEPERLKAYPEVENCSKCQD